MPITPFHFGPGLALKAAWPRRVSWGAFCAANVLIDVETAYNIARHRYPLHRELHTFIGATLAGLAVGAALAGLGRALPRLRSLLGTGVAWEGEWHAQALLWGGLLGGATHPLFDGLMHDDIRPFLPFSEGNPLLGLVGLGSLHLFCLFSGALGAGLLLSRRR